MKVILIVSVSLLLGMNQFMFGQIAVTSSVPHTSRYEIVQAPDAVRYTFKLDKFTGRVFQLTDVGEGAQTRIGWREMLIVDAPRITSSGAKPRFQIFCSGNGIRYTFLLDVDTGKSWIISRNTNAEGETRDLWTPTEN